jgi:hypothetical protein
MYFLYILQQLQKKYNIILELEIIKLIYHYHKIIDMLKKYNFFELINILNKTNLTCIMNKKTIINKLYFNYNFNNITKKYNNIRWYACTYKKKLFNIIIKDNNNNIMEIYNGDIIYFKDNIYIINMSSKIYQNYINKFHIINFIKLKNLKTNLEINYNIQDFINIFIYEDITYIYSIYFNSNK